MTKYLHQDVCVIVFNFALFESPSHANTGRGCDLSRIGDVGSSEPAAANILTAACGRFLSVGSF